MVIYQTCGHINSEAQSAFPLPVEIHLGHVLDHARADLDIGGKSQDLEPPDGLDTLCSGNDHFDEDSERDSDKNAFAQLAQSLPTAFIRQTLIGIDHLRQWLGSGDRCARTINASLVFSRT